MKIKKIIILVRILFIGDYLIIISQIGPHLLLIKDGLRKDMLVLLLMKILK